MADRTLRRLKREELLEMLLEQSKENEKLRGELAALKAEAEERAIRLQQAGSIADAAFEMNHVLEAAQAAADQYLESVRLLCEQQKKELEEERTAEQQKTWDLCRKFEWETARRCREMEEASRRRCREIEQETMDRRQEASEQQE